MGLLKLSNAAASATANTGSKLVSCDNIRFVEVAIANSGATAICTVDIIYGIAAGDDESLVKSAITYAVPGASNEYTLTLAEIESAWLDALSKMSEASGMFVEAPRLGVKVTATGAALADAIPTVVIKKSGILS
tara:strand:- start:55 stop:456 length:402 start_codon:yes stop_codon:yes gene_type:complete